MDWKEIIKVFFRPNLFEIGTPVQENPANSQHDKYIIITSKCFDIIITCLLHCVFAGNLLMSFPPCTAKPSAAMISTMQRINGSLFSMRKDFNYLPISMFNRLKMQINVYPGKFQHINVCSNSTKSISMDNILSGKCNKVCKGLLRKNIFKAVDKTLDFI